MWQKASKRIIYSVHAIVLEIPRSGSQARSFYTIGTSFSIRAKPKTLFITNAHVICEKNGKPRDEKRLVLATFLPQIKAAVCGIGILFIDLTLDIAVFRASKEAADVVPAVFAKPTILEMGTAVASLGFPIPPSPKLRPGGGNLIVTKRLATGFISQNDAQIELDRDTGQLKHYEINMLSYPGLSGAPVFDVNGLVVGINRGTLKYRDNIASYIASYAYAVRSPEIIECLEKNKVEIIMDPNS